MSVSDYLAQRILQAQDEAARAAQEARERERIETEREQTEAIERFSAEIEPLTSEELRAALEWRYSPYRDEDNIWRGLAEITFDGATLQIRRHDSYGYQRYHITDPKARGSYTLAEPMPNHFERDLLLALGEFHAERTRLREEYGEE